MLVAEVLHPPAERTPRPAHLCIGHALRAERHSSALRSHDLACHVCANCDAISEPGRSGRCGGAYAWHVALRGSATHVQFVRHYGRASWPNYTCSNPARIVTTASARPLLDPAMLNLTRSARVRSSTSTWTPSLRPSNSVTIRNCAESPSRSEAPANAASSRRQATRRVSLVSAPRCLPSSPPGNVPPSSSRSPASTPTKNPP